MSTFVVTGGTGRIGTTFVHEIAARGHRVRLGTRDPEGASARVRAAFGPGLVEAVHLDIEAPSSLDDAFKGAEGGLLIAPFGEMQAWHEAMAKAAAKAGVAHLVKVSVTGARAPGPDSPPVSIPGMHWAGEEAVRASGVPSTMIRPTIFAQHFLGMSPVLFKHGDTAFHLPTGEAKVAFLDCRDIAIAAAAVLTAKDRAAWAGRAFELTGPTPVTGEEIAQTLSDVAGRAIAHVDGMEAFSKHAAELGVPDGIKGVYGEAAGGWFGEVSDAEFVELTGRRTTSFAKFAFDHAAFFR